MFKRSIASFCIGCVTGAVVVFVCLMIFFNILQSEKSVERFSKICFKDNTFYLETASTRGELSRGLMYRKHLDDDKGMLFVFEGSAVRSFWMKDTFIPLDIIWLSENATVLYVVHDAQPCGTIKCESIIPPMKASLVLELNAGIAKKIGLTVGNRFDLC